MPRMRYWGWLVLTLATSGCFYTHGFSATEDRKAVNPAPATVQDEIRDARYFLPYPDESIGPPTEFGPLGAENKSP